MKGNPKYFIATSASLTALLALIVWLVVTGRADSFDFPVRNAILAASPSNEVYIWKEITFFGSSLAITSLTILLIVILTVRNEWRTALYFAVVMVGTSVIDLGLKWAIHRARPTEVFPHTMPSSYSFPSGHAMFSFAFYITLALIVVPRVNRSNRAVVLALAITLIVLVGASRILLGVHYPLDVIAGYDAAALWLTLVQWHHESYFSPGGTSI